MALSLPILNGPLAGRRWLVNTRINFFLGTYEPEQTQAFQQAVRPGTVVYDIGAHVGYYTMLAAVLTGEQGTVCAFEPSPRNYARLAHHVAANRCDHVKLYDCAVSDHEGTAHFETRCGSGVGHLSDGGELEVKLITLDALVARDNLPMPQVMKIDVERAEVAVFAGARELLARARPAIFLSTHGADIKQQCLRLLADEFGYTFRTFDGAPLETAADFLAAPPSV